MKPLEGKTAVVTGGSRGIGAAIAQRLAADGAAVVISYVRDAGAAERVTEAIAKDGGRSIAVQADVADPAQVTALFNRVKTEFGKVDILVANAGVAEFAPLEQITPEHVTRQFDVNVRGLLLTIKEVAALMSQGGRIVAVSSIVGKTPMAGTSVYSASKAAVDAAINALAQELGPRGITINTVAPGPVETDMYYNAGFDKNAEYLASRTPLGRIGKPDDIAGAVALLASEDSAWITGQVLTAAGGFRP
jgi:3-oxoacyl-[acyl-carrier protein] reductase